MIIWVGTGGRSFKSSTQRNKFASSWLQMGIWGQMRRDRLPRVWMTWLRGSELRTDTVDLWLRPASKRERKKTVMTRPSSKASGCPSQFREGRGHAHYSPFSSFGLKDVSADFPGFCVFLPFLCHSRARCVSFLDPPSVPAPMIHFPQAAHPPSRPLPSPSMSLSLSLSLSPSLSSNSHCWTVCVCGGSNNPQN